MAVTCFLQSQLIAIEDLAVGPVAYCVRAHLETRFKGSTRGREHGIHGKRSHAVGIGAIAVGLQQPCTTRTQSTVAIELYCAYGERAGGIYLWPFVEPLVHQVAIVAGYHYIQARGKLVVVFECMEQPDVLARGASIVKAGNAVLRAGFQRQGERLGVCVFCIFRNMTCDERHGPFVEYTRRVAELVADHFATRTRLQPELFFSQCGYACGFHSARIGHSSMAAGMTQEHRIIGRYFAEAFVYRKSFYDHIGFCIPFFLVPSAAYDPLPGFGLLYRLAHTLYQLIVALYIHEVQVERIVTHAHKVAVAFYDAGSHGFSMKVYHLGTFAYIRLGIGFGTYEHDASVSYGNALCGRILFVNCIDRSAGYNEVRALMFAAREQ